MGEVAERAREWTEHPSAGGAMEIPDLEGGVGFNDRVVPRFRGILVAVKVLTFTHRQDARAPVGAEVENFPAIGITRVSSSENSGPDRASRHFLKYHGSGPAGRPDEALGPPNDGETPGGRDRAQGRSLNPAEDLCNNAHPPQPFPYP